MGQAPKNTLMDMDVTSGSHRKRQKYCWFFRLSFLIGLEREEHKSPAPAILIRWRPHVSIDRAHRLRHGASVRRATVADDIGICRSGRISDGVLPIQAVQLHAGRRYFRNVRLGHIFDRRPGIQRTILDRHHACRGRNSSARAEGCLESLAKRIAADEILTFTKFLLLTAVILPVVPNRGLGPFQINPFKTWLVVAAVSAISYGSYVIGQLTKGQGGIILAAILGGAYSSTVTTMVMAKRAARENRPHLFAGGTLMASGMMYLRLIVLLGIFNRNLANTALALHSPCWLFSRWSLDWLWSRLADSAIGSGQSGVRAQESTRVPCGIPVRGSLFLGMLIVTHYALVYMGKAGLYSLAAVMGVVDVDPFILGMTQSTGVTTQLAEAAGAILIAAASNNLVKGIYAFASPIERPAFRAWLCWLPWPPSASYRCCG